MGAAVEARRRACVRGKGRRACAWGMGVGRVAGMRKRVERRAAASDQRVRASAFAVKVEFVVLVNLSHAGHGQVTADHGRSRRVKGAHGRSQHRQVKAGHSKSQAGHGQVTTGHGQVTTGHGRSRQVTAGATRCRCIGSARFSSRRSGSSSSTREARRPDSLSESSDSTSESFGWQTSRAPPPPRARQRARPAACSARARPRGGSPAAAHLCTGDVWWRSRRGGVRASCRRASAWPWVPRVACLTAVALGPLGLSSIARASLSALAWAAATVACSCVRGGRVLDKTTTSPRNTPKNGRCAWGRWRASAKGGRPTIQRPNVF